MSDNNSLIIKNGTCYIDGKLVNTDITVSGGKIKSIGKADLNNHKVYDAENKIVLPGIIDTQVHFREPGSTDAEDLESGSRAAVLGGVTSLFEMPNIDDVFDKNDVFGTIEAVKTLADLFLPVSGKIIEINESLESSPELVNSSPYNDGWLVKIEVGDTTELEDLLNSKDYKNLIS